MTTAKGHVKYQFVLLRGTTSGYQYIDHDEDEVEGAEDASPDIIINKAREMLEEMGLSPTSGDILLDVYSPLDIPESADPYDAGKGLDGTFSESNYLRVTRTLAEVSPNCRNHLIVVFVLVEFEIFLFERGPQSTTFLGCVTVAGGLDQTIGDVAAKAVGGLERSYDYEIEQIFVSKDELSEKHPEMPTKERRTKLLLTKSLREIKDGNHLVVEISFSVDCLLLEKETYSTYTVREHATCPVSLEDPVINKVVEKFLRFSGLDQQPGFRKIYEVDQIPVDLLKKTIDEDTLWRAGAVLVHPLTTLWGAMVIVVLGVS